MEIDYDEEEEEEFDRVLTSTLCLVFQYYNKYIYKRSCMTSTQTGNKWLKEILEGNNSRCCIIFRMEKDIFKRLCYDLETNYGLCASRRISAAETLAIFLFVLGGGNSNKSTKERFQHSGETISRKFEEVLQAVCKMAIDIIQPKDRDFKEVPTKLRNDDRYWPHFKNAIGAIDGTHVPVIVSTEDQIRFIGRKGIPTQNVMVACNFDMEFIFAFAGWEVIAHDTRVFLHAIGTSELNFPKPPPGKYYLVDAGYLEKKGYLGPYKGATYHLPEFRRVNGPSGYYEIYNYAHSSLRSVIERTFGVWKKRWKILRDMPSFSYKKQIQIVIATMALHNYIRRYSTSDRKFKKYDQMDVELEEEDGYGNEGEAENGVEKVGDEFLGTMEMVRNNIASSLISGKN
ncbi:putative nuclease HARBI1 [Arachis ipaensis]|uniref:uncharacterized protein n=1 Tax=Arachis hypogaea TaxID=3818 RepID=UPI0007AF0BC4|nr:putative nuclease HARBI1 [Arachis ipaensis]XP_025647621.1 putative nuclease HARBI1 [Arachis hypogaea]